jgi:hypothetical protein
MVTAHSARIALALGTVFAASTAAAHHSPAMFDGENKRTLSGTVREFQWSNPHCYIQLLVSNDKGEQEEWSLEMAGPSYIYAHGWRRSTLKPGDRITVTIAPLRNGDHGGQLFKAAMADGRAIGDSK